MSQGRAVRRGLAGSIAALLLSACAGRSPAPAPAAAAEPAGSPLASSTTLAGCLVAADEAAAAAFPPPPVTRAGGEAPFHVTPAPGGALVEHALTHACCLKARVTTRLSGRTAAVLEQLSGAACRCYCGSTIRTTVTLPPGAWTVTVDLEDSGGLRRIGERPVEVR